LPRGVGRGGIDRAINEADQILYAETLYGADFVKGVPCGAYRYFSMSVSLFDLDNPFPRPDPYAMRWPARAEAVKDGA
jgi:hypothetical protein